MAGKNLTFKLVMDADVKNYVSNIKQSESVTKSVLTTIKAESDRLKGASGGAAEGLNALSNEARSTAQHVSTLDQAISQTNTELAQTDTAAQTAQKGIAGLRTGYTALIGVMGGIGIGLGIRELAAAADSYTNLSARINIATSDGGNFEQAMAGVHQVALMTNSSLDATAGLFTKVNDVGKQMGLTQQQNLDLVKTINMAIQTGGGSAASTEAAVYQFTQALQSGVLRGDEFNSIMEQAPGISKALARSLGVTTDELRKMAENGELSSEKVIKAIQSQSKAIEADYAKFPTTIGNALQRIKTQWEILIGTMDQSNGASATVAQWMVTIADNMTIVETLLSDIGEGFVWAGDQLKKIDPATIEEFKTALSGAYETVKSFGTVLAGAFERGIDLTNTALSSIFNFSSGVDVVGDKTNGFTKFLQALNVALGFLGDGFNAINIVMDLFIGALYSAGSAWEGLKATFTFGDVKDQAIANMTAMQAKAEEYYQKASNGALNFESQGKKAWEEIGKSQDQKNVESLLKNQQTLDQLKAQEEKHKADYKAISDERVKAEQQLFDARKSGNQAAIDLAVKGLADLDAKEKVYQAESKKISDEKIKAAQDWVNAQLVAADGTQKAADAATQKTMQTTLAAQGLKLEFDGAGKAIVKAMGDGSVAITNTNVVLNKAKAGATALGIDIDVSLNKVSKKFSETKGSLDNFVAGLEDMGATGQQAADLTYQGWLKWLETAKSQAEIDFAKTKLKEFGDQGQISTSQVEQGLIAIKLQAQKLPDDIDPVTEAFKRLGIQTKEQLRLSAQMALSDFEVVRQSGQATQADLQKAYEKTIQLAYASGDAQSIAAANAKAASLGLSVQVSDTGQVAVKSNDEWEKSNHRVRDSAEKIGDGYRNAGQIAREEAESAGDAWEAAVEKSRKEFKDELSNQQKLLNSLSDYQSYSKEDVLAALKSKGYSDKEAQKLAGSIWSQGLEADREAKYSSSGRGGFGGMDMMVRQEFDRAAAKGLTTQNGTNKINDLLRQMNSSSLVSTGSVPKAPSVDINSLAPNVSTPVPTPATTDTSKAVNYNISFGGQTLSLSGSAEQESVMNQLINQLKTQAKST